jgi:hypothetical protein
LLLLPVFDITYLKKPHYRKQHNIFVNATTFNCAKALSDCFASVVHQNYASPLMSRYLLDTNIVINVLKRRPLEVLSTFNTNASRMTISSITSRTDARRREKPTCG